MILNYSEWEPDCLLVKLPGGYLVNCTYLQVILLQTNLNPELKALLR